MNLKMNRLYMKIAIGIMLTAIVFVCAAFSTFSKKNEPMETISLEALYMTYESAEELDEADLILIGTPTSDFSDREHKTSYYEDGSLQDFYTLTEIEIDKMIKSPNDFDLEESETLSIIEPVGMIELDGTKKITIDEYKEMEQGEKYIIFLNDNGHGQYSVINNDLGKFNLDSKSAKSEKSLSKNSGIALKEDVLEKYSEFIE
ncbi:hypothetical protein HPY27_10145 [Brevibacillus sp. HB1.1]|uniref:hypothetical protein n=1 Tax=Brevibacillus sp. HB1.1 TaxID=2738808 RepID=UPI0015758440|nr:hypothetical protein [Brevibacillus sp. HB1.1]NTU30503.1 hypothetical protein [Brevibacillus sp. HB1.1]